MLVQISKHLLTALQPTIHKENHRDGFISQFRSLSQSLFDSGTSVLTIVDDEPGGHWNLEPSDMAGILSKRLEENFSIHRRGDRRKYVFAGIIDEVTANFRYTRAV